jgi:hypothetical protein
MIIPQGSAFTAARTTELAQPVDLAAFQRPGSAALVVEPAGRMAMAACHVANRTAQDYSIHRPMYPNPSRGFPTALEFPPMLITKLENAWCLPHAPPFVQSPNRVVVDFVAPWGPDILGWFRFGEDGVYRARVDLDTAALEYDIDTAFYMDHAISAHYGHFIGDCLCRIYAWDVCRALFGDMPVILADDAGKAGFQGWFFNAAGVPGKNLVRIKGLVRVRRLLLATQSFGIQRYTSPTAARSWGTIRDRGAIRDVSLPDRIYVSRRGVDQRRLVNESEVECIFERHGFAIIRPEALPVQVQVALFSNALLVAGPGGSGMFNLAFQGRMRSAMILRWDEFLQMPEMLFCAGRSSDVWFHLGHRHADRTSAGAHQPWAVDPARLESDVADWIVHAGC